MKALYIIILAIILSSCGLSIYVPKGEVSPVPKGIYSSGAAAVEITTPPGYSMGGFGNELSKIARGWWTRLYAKSFYYEDPLGNQMVIVATDLWSVSQGLCDKIMFYLHKYGKPYKLPREWVTITATHTHHSPGNFSSSMGYNLGSSALRGFDQDLFDFLAKKIAFAIKQSIDNSAPSDIYYGFQNLEGQTRNRSLDAFYLNGAEEQKQILDKISFKSEFFNESSYCFMQDTNVFKAVDPTLTSIIAKKKDTDTVTSILSVYGVHPTVIGPNNALISSDIFGVASITVSNYIQSKTKNSVITGFLNGQNGDISANWHRQDRENTERIGLAIANACLENAHSNDLTKIASDFQSKLEFKEIRNAVITGTYQELECGNEIIQQTAATPSMGKPAKKGTEDGRPEHICVADECFYDEGNPKDECNGTQGAKKEMAITKLISGSAPNLVAVGLYSLGSLKMVFLPGETTTALGERLKDTAKEEGDEHVVLVSLANDYASYFTTPSEYQAQHYEGASTIYGPATAFFFKEFIERIKLSSPRSDGYYKKKKYKAGIKVKKGAIENNWLDYPWSFNEDLFYLFQSIYPTDLNRTFSLEWYAPVELNPSLSNQQGRLVSTAKIEVKNNNDEWEDLSLLKTDLLIGEYEEIQSDQSSTNFISYVKTTDQLSLVWESIWLIPETYQSNRAHRLVIQTKDGITISSNNFFIPQN